MTGWHSTLQHPDNDHWAEWREAVERTGHTDALKIASQRLLMIERLTPRQVMIFLCAVNCGHDSIAASYRKMARNKTAWAYEDREIRWSEPSVH